VAKDIHALIPIANAHKRLILSRRRRWRDCILQLFHVKLEDLVPLVKASSFLFSNNGSLVRPAPQTQLEGARSADRTLTREQPCSLGHEKLWLKILFADLLREKNIV
jgi:hypothetical protein